MCASTQLAAKGSWRVAGTRNNLCSCCHNARVLTCAVNVSGQGPVGSDMFIRGPRLQQSNMMLYILPYWIYHSCLAGYAPLLKNAVASFGRLHHTCCKVVI